jgi:hypothetical protein
VRNNNGTTALIYVTAALSYDSHALGSGDTLYCNDTVMTWSGSLFTYETSNITDITGILFYVNSTGELTHLITAININSKSVTVIWTQMTISNMTASSSSVSTGSPVVIYAMLNYTYDGAIVTTGTINILHGGTQAILSASYSNNWWYVSTTHSVAETVNFTVYSVVDGYGVDSLLTSSLNTSVEFTTAAWTGNPPNGNDPEPSPKTFYDDIPWNGLVLVGVGLAVYVYYTPAIKSYFKSKRKS